MANKTTKTVPLLCTSDEAAVMLSVSKQTLMNYVKEGQLTCVRLKQNCVRFRVEDIELFIEDHLAKGDPIEVSAA